MPNIESMISAQKIIFIKKYLYTDPAGWKIFLDFYLKNVGAKYFCLIVTLTILNYR